MNATKKIHDFAIGNPFHSSLIGRFARTLARPPRRPNTYIHRKVAAIYIQDIASRRSDGADACPPEDVCGARGYLEFLAALADPDHEEHERLLGVGRRALQCSAVLSRRSQPPAQQNQVHVVNAPRPDGYRRATAMG